MFQALSVPSVLVDDIPYAIKPNSFEYDPGYGEVNVTSASLGGSKSISVHTENAENKIGRVKFEMQVTEAARAAIALWKQGIGIHRVVGVQKGAAPIVLNGASMTNNPTLSATADGVVEVEFMGDQMITP